MQWHQSGFIAVATADAAGADGGGGGEVDVFCFFVRGTVSGDRPTHFLEDGDFRVGFDVSSIPSVNRLGFVHIHVGFAFALNASFI